MITIEEVKAKTPERFWSKIKFGEPNECWEWQAGVRFKYGAYHLTVDGKEKMAVASRHMYGLIFGGFDKKLFVLHKCDNPPCCNPNHLWLGTTRNNVDDKIEKRRLQWGTQIHTHKLTEDQVRLIRMRLECGDTATSLSKHFGIAISSLCKIGARQNWKYLTDY